MAVPLEGLCPFCCVCRILWCILGGTAGGKLNAGMHTGWCILVAGRSVSGSHI